jgi:hypothetical protein
MIVFDASTLILIAKAELLDSFLTGIELEAAIPVESVLRSHWMRS